MAKGRELKGRIKSVENTRKITRTLEMVATSKMKRAQDRVMAARPYATVLSDVISSLYSSELAERFPLLRQPPVVRRAAVLVLTSNRGLAGAFNSNILREARNLIARLGSENVEVELHVVGRKGLGYFRYVGRAVASSRTAGTFESSRSASKSSARSTRTKALWRGARDSESSRASGLEKSSASLRQMRLLTGWNRCDSMAETTRGADSGSVFRVPKRPSSRART